MLRTGVLLGALVGVVALSVGPTGHAQSGKPWYPYAAQEHIPPFQLNGPIKNIEYTPLKKADKEWRICVSFPHLKDPYWLAVDYGVADESKQLGVSMQLVEAGGYTNLGRQISEIEDCVAGGAQAVVIGAISYTGLNQTVARLKQQGIPVVDLVNGMSSPAIAARSAVSFKTMAEKAGEYLVKLNPQGGTTAEVAWFPGPAGAGWVVAGNEGFNDALKGSALKIVATKYGDTGKEIQLKLVEDVLAAYPNIKYIVGTAPTAEAAVQILRERGLSDKIKVISYYFTPPVYESIKRGQVLAAPTDSAVIQGRIAIDQAVRILEHKPYIKDAGPAIYLIDKSNVNSFDKPTSLAPDGFKPIFNVG
ncbi:MAG: TMAO reductase system periplasmic protein TorT [Acetobacteraceae bacterium]